MSLDNELYQQVYGAKYISAETQMSLIVEAIEQQKGVGFNSPTAAAAWAKEHNLDNLVYAKGKFEYVTHYGEVTNKQGWSGYYSEALFWWRQKQDNDGQEAVPWVPTGFAYHEAARIEGETSNGIRKPLNHRDYFVPTGYYDPTRGTYNTAKPFPVPAKETGRDTSHIYTYIEHVAGVCAPWLLAWLRAKIIYPTQKTHVIPIIISKAQGSGKSTFAEVICRGLFGRSNVVVTDQFDSTAKFNGDYADALIVCLEEKEETDKRNPMGALKSRATADTIRDERKNKDPVFKDSFHEYLMTTNKDVPVKFDGPEDQRRFMIMGADEKFTRKESATADEVFTKLRGQDKNYRPVGTPFVDDHALIAQFKHELVQNEALAEIDLRGFPKTPEYERCFTLPRTSENSEIESILRALSPFIKASLVAQQIVTAVEDEGQILQLAEFLTFPSAMQYVPAAAGRPAMVALCRPVIFSDISNNKPFAHSTVERAMYDADSWLRSEYGVQLFPYMKPLPGGFLGMAGRYKMAPAACFCLSVEDNKEKNGSSLSPILPHKQLVPREGERLRVNGKWRPDPDGEFETVNELKPGIYDLQNKTQNVQYMDTFVFECDEVSKTIYRIEESRLQSGEELEAQNLFAERLHAQRAEADKLYNAGVACRVVYSGGKSYHVLVRVKDAPRTLEEYKWLHAHLCSTLSDKLVFDPVNSDPARLTRAPITFVRYFEYHGVQIKGTQALVSCNWHHVYDCNWRPLYAQWLSRPLTPAERAKGIRLVPMKLEYKEAANALLEGSFWSDAVWHGKRQRCFFPAYRLCRMLGFSHDELWTDEGILDGLSDYYRQNEVTYWRGRQTSDIIKQIDADIDTMIEAEKEAPEDVEAAPRKSKKKGTKKQGN